MAMSKQELLNEAVRALRANEPVSLVVGRAEIHLDMDTQHLFRSRLLRELTTEVPMLNTTFTERS